MIKYYFITYVLLMLFSNGAYASGTITNLFVEEVITGYTEDGLRATVRIKLKDPHGNPDGCTQPKFIVLINDNDVLGANDGEDIASTFFHQQYSMALAAALNNTKLKAFVDGCSVVNDQTGLKKYPIAKRLHLIP